jgi:anti-anti-sigma factor
MASCEQEQVGSATVIRLMGFFVTDEDIKLISNAMDACIAANVRCLVVNWSGVDHMSSTGIGVIFKGHSAIMKRGGSCQHCAFPKRMEKLLAMMKMMPFWIYFETEEEAVASCPMPPADGARRGGAATEHPGDGKD